MNARIEELRENLAKVEAQIQGALRLASRNREDVTLVVVTKTYPVEDLLALYELGVRNFGENRDQEGSLKAPHLPPDTHWHFQGQIQSRKIPSLAQWADSIHSLDSLEHAAKFEKLQNSEKLNFFLQINLEEGAEHRGGVHVNEVSSFLESCTLPIAGAMVVAPLGSDPLEAFSKVKKIADEHGLKEISMGMSGDFEAALVAGATHIRVGSSILGSRSLLA